MEVVIDAIRDEIKTLSETLSEDGGVNDILSIRAIYFGDPIIVPTDLYPCVLVEPNDDDDHAETTGYDKRLLKIRVTLMIDAREYFDASVDEATGDRLLVQATAKIAQWFRRRSKRTLDGRVMDTKVLNIDYRKQERGAVAAKASQLHLLIEKVYARVLD